MTAADALVAEGREHELAGERDHALAAYRRALAVDRDHAQGNAHLGVLLLEQDRVRAAAACFERYRVLRPADPFGHAKLAEVLAMDDRGDEAVAVLEAYLARPDALDRVRLWDVLGQVHYLRGDLDAALGWFERALQASPDDDTLRWDASFTFMSAGRVSEAWALRDSGMRCGKRPQREPGAPQWAGEELRASSLMVWQDQGIGDDIMMASCYEELAQRCGRLIIETDPRLIPLYRRSFPGVEARALRVDARFAETHDADYDLHCPATSVPRWLRPDTSSFPEERPYLVADPGRVAAWRERLGAPRRRPRVGISWRSMLQTAERRREYTDLSQWGPMLALPGVVWVNLQYDECERELQEAETRFGVEIVRPPGLDLMRDLDGVAALVASLDMVVCPSNVVGMLAGALGTPALELAVYPNPWELGTGRFPWQPLRRSFQRRCGEPWDGVVAVAAEALAECCAMLSGQVASERNSPTSCSTP